MPINPLATHVTVHLDQARKMRYTMNSIAEAEGVIGCSIILDRSEHNVFKQMKAGKGNLRFTRALLWAGLLPDNPELTLEEAGDLITVDRLKEIYAGINMALRLFFQKQGMELPEEPLPPAENEIPAAEAEKAPPGTGSGPSLVTTSG